MIYFINNLGQLLDIFAVILVWFVFWGLGNVFSLKGGEAPFLGFAASALLTTIVGVAFHVSLMWIFLGAGITVFFTFHRKFSDIDVFIKLILLLLPILLMIAAMQASQWDEFSHWLYSGRYLLDNDAYPRLDLPKSQASFPGYPYSWPWLAYLVGMIRGHYVEAAGGMMNIFLLGFFGLAVVQHFLPQGKRLGWVEVALALLLATLCNPTFVEKLVFTAYADVATATAAGFAALFAMKFLEKLPENASDAFIEAIKAGLALSLLLGVKQGNIGLALSIVMALGLLGLRLPTIKFLNFSKGMLLLLVFPLLQYGFWRYHLNTHLPGQEFPMQPFANWNLGIIPEILARMALVASKKGVYFGIMLLVSGFGIYQFFKPGKGPAFAFLGLAFLGYNAFLFFSYIAAFGADDAKNAISFWRYNTHLGLLAVLGLVFALKEWEKKIPPGLKKAVPVAMVLILIAPIALAKQIRFDIDPQKTHIRETTREIGKLLPKDSKVKIADPLGTGLACKMADYEMGAPSRVHSCYSAFINTKEEDFLGPFKNTAPTHLWAHNLDEKLAVWLNIDPAKKQSHLFRLGPEGKWEYMRSWDYPPNSGDRMP